MSTSARFGRVGLGDLKLSTRFDSNQVIRLTNEITGAFRGGSFQHALSVANEKMAGTVQTSMAASLKRNVQATGRRQRGGERLANTILDPRNRDVTASGFIVGRPSWYDRSPAALYWRRIEEGDASTFSAYILFTNDFQKFVGPWSPSGGKRKTPAGYPHMRMPQHRGVWTQNIGPFPAYRYHAAGLSTFTAIDVYAHYKTTLSSLGLRVPLTKR